MCYTRAIKVVSFEKFFFVAAYYVIYLMEMMDLKWVNIFTKVFYYTVSSCSVQGKQIMK